MNFQNFQHRLYQTRIRDAYPAHQENYGAKVKIILLIPQLCESFNDFFDSGTLFFLFRDHIQIKGNEDRHKPPHRYRSLVGIEEVVQESV